MPVSSFNSETQRERFVVAATLYVRGGPLARTCGAKLRTGGVCSQLALAGEARCLRHGGPDAARRFRERQKAGLTTGSVSPDEWARAEAKRARNALQWAWRKDPRLPGRTIDLGLDEATFAASAAALGVDVDTLYPALSDWLRWHWRRHQKDRPDAARWVRAVREELPRQRAAADEAVAWASLGIMDRRTRAARAARTALRSGDMSKAQAAVAAVKRATEAAQGLVATRFPKASTVAGPSAPAKPWSGRPAATGLKRRLPDRTKPPVVAKVPGKPGRPRRRPVEADELAALGHVLWQAGPQVRAMFVDLSTDEDRLSFLLDLRAVAAAPDRVQTQQRWSRWVKASANRA